MTEELRAKMEELRAIAPRLNKTSDSASTIIRSVEKFLNDLGIGVSSEGHFDESPGPEGDDGEPRKVCYYLAYGRMHGEFCIHILEQTTKSEVNTYGGYDDVPESEERYSWSGVAREVKLKSFASLPRLLDNILRTAKQQAEEADKAAAQVGEMLTTLGLPNPDAETEDASKAVNSAPVVKRKTSRTGYRGD